MSTPLTQDFRHRTGGSVSMLFALLAFVFAGFIGFAVDYSRWNNLRARTADALDTALLAGARALQTEQSEAAAIEKAKKTFLSAAKNQLDIVSPEVDVTLVNNGTALEGVAWGKVRTPFLGFVKARTLKVAANSRVGFSLGGGSTSGGSDLEISMMLDVTGSMCADGSGPCSTSSKMDALKSASTDLVNIIMKSGSAGARIALVPFATRVRLGLGKDNKAENLMKKLTDLPSKWSGWYATCPNATWVPPANSETSGTWTCGVPVPVQESNWPVMPCVTDRTGPEAFTDAAPGSNQWLNAHGGHRFPKSDDSSDTPISVSVSGDTSAHAASHWEYNSDGSCDGIDEKDAIMPLTSDKTALLDRINGLVAYGATAGTLGTAWSWYMLTPGWKNIWTGQSQPGAYEDTVASGSNPPKLRKIAVLMTDGVYNTTRGWLDQDPAQMAADAKAVCANMKTKGVEIYTVGFDLDALSAADHARAVDTLQSCGSDLSHFYDALNAEQLKQSFRDIAMQLSQIYVAK